MNAADIVSTLRPRLADALIATDFDGTLAPLVADPEASRAVPGAIDVLRDLAGTGARIAVITGRDAETVLRLSGLAQVPGLTVAGVYGAEVWRDGHLSTPETPEEIVALRRELPAVLRDADPAVWIEDKRLSLVVHTRRTDDPAGERDRLVEPVTEIGERLGFDVDPGSGVLELRLPGYDKGAALRGLADGRGAVLYLGDDLGDLPAFAEIQRLRGVGVAALSVGVRSSGVDEVAAAADTCVDDPAAVVQLLRSLV